jgi:hypothetical protein
MIWPDGWIGKAVKKNASLDADRYQALGGKMEYFDLRELQDVITSLWPNTSSLTSTRTTRAA